MSQELFARNALKVIQWKCGKSYLKNYEKYSNTFLEHILE